MLYFVGLFVYRLYFHPLAKVPGPWYNKVSRIPFAIKTYYGLTGQNAVELHEKYGEVVRISPDQVSFTSGDTAWQEIYGFRTGKQRGEPTMAKNRRWYPPAAAGGYTCDLFIFS